MHLVFIKATLREKVGEKRKFMCEKKNKMATKIQKAQN